MSRDRTGRKYAPPSQHVGLISVQSIRLSPTTWVTVGEQSEPFAVFSISYPWPFMEPGVRLDGTETWVSRFEVENIDDVVVEPQRVVASNVG